MLSQPKYIRQILQLRFEGPISHYGQRNLRMNFSNLGQRPNQILHSLFFNQTTYVNQALSLDIRMRRSKSFPQVYPHRSDRYLIGINAELFYAIRLHCLTNHCHMRGMLNDPALYPMQRLCLKPKKITTMGRQENRNFLTKEDFQKKRHQTLGNNPMSMDGVVGI